MAGAGEGEGSRRYWALSDEVIGSCIEVHQHLGPGLLESAYQVCLGHELSLRGVRFESQRSLPVEYKGGRLDCGYRLDFLIEDVMVVEVKAVDRLLAVHEAQLITYLKLTGFEVGLLVNFNVAVLRDGIRRLRRRTELPRRLPASVGTDAERGEDPDG